MSDVYNSSEWACGVEEGAGIPQIRFGKKSISEVCRSILQSRAKTLRRILPCQDRCTLRLLVVKKTILCVCACVLQRSLISWVNRFFALQPANKGTFREGLFLCVVGLCWLLYLFQKQLPPQYLKVAWGAKRQGLHFFCTAWWFTKGARFCFGWYGACPAIAETDSLVLSKHEPTLTLPRQR